MWCNGWIISISSQTSISHKITFQMDRISYGETDNIQSWFLSVNSNCHEYDIRMFYSQLNNVLGVLGKYSQEMSTLHLVKTYCLVSTNFTA